MSSTRVQERSARFSSRSVRAMLARTKFQARFPIKGQSADWDKLNPEWDVKGNEFFMVCGRPEPGGLRKILTAITCPYGQPGDRIWVKETHSFAPDPEEPAGCAAVLYKADGDHPYRAWRSSVHMPREASRILLELARVRVERLHDISEADAIAEGAAPDTSPDTEHFKLMDSVRTARFDYGSIWASDTKGWSWASNPWVWVLEFTYVDER